MPDPNQQIENPEVSEQMKKLSEENQKIEIDKLREALEGAWERKIK